MADPQLEHLLRTARSHADDVERLTALRKLELDLAETAGHARAHRAATIRNLREIRPDLSWSSIGTLLGVSGERARQMADEA